jgi:hypothetical protein
MGGKWDEAILRAVDELWRENCYPPTLAQIMGETGITTKSVVWYALRRLAKRRFIVLRDARPIALWVIAALTEKVVRPGEPEGKWAYLSTVVYEDDDLQEV